MPRIFLVPPEPPVDATVFAPAGGFSILPPPAVNFVMRPRMWIVLGALLAAAAVGWGAYHAHGLEKLLHARGAAPAELQRQMHDFDVAVRYQAMHAVALVLVGLVGMHVASRWLDFSAFFFALGILLFSACLETSVLVGIRLPWFLVPAGGLALIAGWIALAIGPLRGRQ